MRKTWTLGLAILLAASWIRAEKLANGLEFRTPDGWTVKTGNEAALLMPPNMVMEPGGKDPSELYLVALIPGIKNLQDREADLKRLVRGYAVQDNYGGVTARKAITESK